MKKILFLPILFLGISLRGETLELDSIPFFGMYVSANGDIIENSQMYTMLTEALRTKPANIDTMTVIEMFFSSFDKELYGQSFSKIDTVRTISYEHIYSKYATKHVAVSDYALLFDTVSHVPSWKSTIVKTYENRFVSPMPSIVVIFFFMMLGVSIWLAYISQKFYQVLFVTALSGLMAIFIWGLTFPPNELLFLFCFIIIVSSLLNYFFVIPYAKKQVAKKQAKEAQQRTQIV